MSDVDPAKSKWAWFEAMSRAALLNRLVADALLENVAVESDPEVSRMIEHVVNDLAEVYEYCQEKMNSVEGK